MRNTIRITLTVLLSVIASWRGNGQDISVTSNGEKEYVSLEQAIRTGTANSRYLKLKEIATQENEEGLKEEITRKLPDLTLQAGAQRNFIIGVTPIPAKMMNPASADGEIYLARFGTDYSGIAGINLQFDIFNPERYGNVAKQKILLALTEVERQDQKELLISNICLDYAATAIALEQLDLCKADTLNSRKYLDYVQTGKSEGRFSEDDCLLARQNMGISRALLLQAESIYINSKSRLLEDMGIDVKDIDPETYVLEDKIDELVNMCQCSGTGEFPMAECFTRGDAERMKDRLELELKKQDIRCSIAGFFPTLCLNGYYGSNYFNDRFQPFRSDKWYGNAFLGLKINYPLIGLSGQSFKLKKNRLAYKRTELEQEEARQKRNLDISSYNTEVLNYGKEIDIRRSNLEFALKRIEIAREKEEEGEMRPDQMNDSIYKMRECRVEYLQCLYNYFTALVNRRISEI